MHRDLKPANLLLSRDRRTLKLADFGLAKRFPRLPAGGECCDGRRRQVFAHSAHAGTPRYTAPEVMASLSLGEHVSEAAVYTEKADIYSAALIISYLLVGRRPERNRTDPAARPCLGLARQRWGELAALVERMWAHDAGARPSAGECLSAVLGLDFGVVGCGAGPRCSTQ